MKTASIFLLAIGLLSCSNDADVPKNVLPQKEMQTVLWDIIRTDMLVNYQHSRDTAVNRFAASTQLYQETFTLHHITKDDFKRSLAFYQAHPDLMQTILDSLYTKSAASSPAKPYTHPTAIP